jgi:hypothetical protein
MKQKRLRKPHSPKNKRRNKNKGILLKKGDNIILENIEGFFSGLVTGFITTMARDMERRMEGPSKVEVKKIEEKNKVLVKGPDGIYREKE